jgi:hypothetical protein
MFFAENLESKVNSFSLRLFWDGQKKLILDPIWEMTEAYGFFMCILLVQWVGFEPYEKVILHVFL